MIQTDKFIEIGSQHKECEDYIIMGSEPVQYIILADGCSTANNSEMGARILCHLAKQYLQYRKDDLYDIDYEKMGLWIIHNAERTARGMGLSKSCLTSTLIVSFELDGFVKIFMYGDGCVISQTSDGSMSFYKMDFSGNAPFYLVYRIDEERFKLYDENSPWLTWNVSTYTGTTSDNITTLAYDQPITLDLSLRLFPTIVIASDGITSFLKDRKPYHTLDFIEGGLLAFKNTKGAFLQRRLNKYMKQLGKAGVEHFDDLSIGAYLRT